MNTILGNNENDNFVTQYLIDEYKSLMAHYELLKMNEFRDYINVEVDDIPKERTPFLGSTDEWQTIDLPIGVNMTGCVYYGKKGNKFPVHKHEGRTEYIFVLEGEGFNYLVENGEKGTLLLNQSLVFPAGAGHYLEWLGDTTIICMWSPSFEDNHWSGDFNKTKN